MFYASIWKKHTLFSESSKPVLIPYNNDIEDIEYENPKVLFGRKQKEASVSCLNYFSMLLPSSSVGSEQFEMQYKYILMEEIQGENKLEVAKTLKDCSDIELFEQESVQHIIDYKWNTYARNFFLMKFLVYCVFLVFYGYDLETIHWKDLDSNLRVKDF